MRLLLDTHMFLWFISGDPKLIEAHRDLIRDPRNEVFLSVVSIWEAIVKWRLGKLPLPIRPLHICRRPASLTTSRRSSLMKRASPVLPPCRRCIAILSIE
jgi:PIN domain nuclease of toxin-antitoxin system